MSKQKKLSKLQHKRNMQQNQKAMKKTMAENKKVDTLNKVVKKKSTPPKMVALVSKQYQRKLGIDSIKWFNQNVPRGATFHEPHNLSTGSFIWLDWWKNVPPKEKHQYFIETQKSVSKS